MVDADGHFIETAPVFKRFFLDFVKDIGGGDLMARFEKAGGMDYDDMVLRPWSAMSEADRRAAWVTRPPWWSLPADTLDRATAHLPRLMYERLDDLGIMGHWDVTDMSGVLAEAHELVEHGLIDEADFRDFVFANPVRFYTSVNPDFFRGTRVEAEAAAVVTSVA